MPGYRLYTLEPLGHFQSATEFFANDDESAIALATQANVGGRKELWCGARLVRKWHTTAAER
jgi:hypothetical protein